MAYGALLAAWQDYLARYNHGRGIVFIGHSQGAMMLIPLLKERGRPGPGARRPRCLGPAARRQRHRRRRVATWAGTSSTFPPADRPGRPAASSPTRASTRRRRPTATSAKWESAQARASQPTAILEVLCVNPASLSGGTGPAAARIWDRSVPRETIGLWLKEHTLRQPTPWWLTPTNTPPIAKAPVASTHYRLTPPISRETKRPVVSAAPTAAWGLHLYDVSLALGNLVDLVRQQSAAFSQE